MSSLLSTLFVAAIDLIVDSGKNAEESNETVLVDENYHGLIVREIDDIKLKLEGRRASEDLLTSIGVLKEGIELLYGVFDKTKFTRKSSEQMTQASGSQTSFTSKLELGDLDESTNTAFATMKETFKDARLKATKAFVNDALEISDRILAMQYRVIATILESIDNLVDALQACKLCIEELHSLPAVQNSFKVELKKGLLSRLNREKRREIIFTVCRINRAIYDITKAVGKGEHVWIWPFVDTGEDKVDPLRDARITNVPRRQGKKNVFVTPWSFGQEEENHKLKQPRRVATNTEGKFIVADYGNSNVTVFESSGKFLFALPLPADAAGGKFYVRDVATDSNGNTYVLVSVKKSGSEEYSVCVFSNDTELHHRIPLIQGTWHWSRFTVTDNGKFMVLAIRERKEVIDVYDSDGQFLRSFGEGVLKDPSDITASNDGYVMVVNKGDSQVHVYNDLGEHLHKFKVPLRSCSSLKIAFHRASEYVVVAGYEKGKAHLHVIICTKDGQFVRRVVLDEEKDDWLLGITVTVEGRIAVAFQDVQRIGKVIVL